MNAKDTFLKISTRIHRAICRASKGRLFGGIVGLPVIELVTTRRRSGKQRSTMLAAPIVEDDRLVLVASYGGDNRQPARYRNLTANPQVQVTTAGSTRTMLAASPPTDQERARSGPRSPHATKAMPATSSGPSGHFRWSSLNQIDHPSEFPGPCQRDQLRPTRSTRHDDPEATR